MKQFFVLILLFISATLFGQKPDWIPFYWEGDSVSGKYFNKLATIFFTKKKKLGASQEMPIF
jgi:hypothetical protein